MSNSYSLMLARSANEIIASADLTSAVDEWKQGRKKPEPAKPAAKSYMNGGVGVPGLRNPPSIAARPKLKTSQEIAMEKLVLELKAKVAEQNRLKALAADAMARSLAWMNS
jgi:hypothetical protein